MEKKIKGDMRIFSASLYNPHGQEINRELNSYLSTLIKRAPTSDEVILDQDINANIEIRDKDS